MGIEFQNWKINCQNINSDKSSSVILSKNITEYIFTDLGKYKINIF